ncbi:TPA: LPXTG cell wall anchor domain-containing protein [Streptococcus pyogenes]|uniref:LPXTG cell wall anchor domain-containing protein n=1 Tax=Streptococcus equi TaxID=1336 RepID=UPI001E5E925B|nr:LPXTG cell wall anchor domain-containing protein [Streptococcus equi]HER6019492.1 LPXTG cell wall anchor domain-containing protein [Streptococcus pyogenes]MCD3382392.1 LPXTG cell wall anchor domain-containing protein [Streptococcus equi subsp. zooepidemicus]HEL0799010.1 LPXTG cell wall anchor domain-containing protein [Streptococcus equi subsp. zooepidemicus]HER6022286.1 LPXTG cell wall anchor domain-containing protein [Streptococcus pyogenes]HER6038262.1 LPXTG cell wall anchor domain-conta
MTKKQLLSVLTATTVALLTTSLTYADETPVPVDPTAPSTEVVTPAPSQPELPVPDKPAEPETPKEELPAPVDPTTPSTGKEDKTETIPGQAETPKEETKPKEEVKPETPKSNEDKKKEELVPDNVSKDIIEKVDTTTGEVVFKPIVVAPNTTVVGTQNSQLLVRDDTGQTTLVAPETLGGHVNPNGTVTITDSTGAKKTLPKTGDKQSVLGYLGMMLVSVLGYAIKKKVSH